MDYKAMLIKLIGLPADADDAAIQVALAAIDAAEADAARVEDDTAAAISSEAKPVTKEEEKEEEEEKGKDAEIVALKSRAIRAEVAFAGARADNTIAKLEDEGCAIASRDDLRKALVADHDKTLAALRAFLPVTASREPLRSRISARTPNVAAAAARDSESDREKAITAAAQTYCLKSRADAVARAQRDRPDLWK